MIIRSDSGHFAFFPTATAETLPLRAPLLDHPASPGYKPHTILAHLSPTKHAQLGGSDGFAAVSAYGLDKKRYVKKTRLQATQHYYVFIILLIFVDG